MSIRRLGIVLGVVAAVLAASAAFFVVNTWPATVPRTWIGWLLAAMVGGPIWFLAEGFAGYAMGQFSRPKRDVDRRYSLEEVRRGVPAADRAKRFATVLVRVAVGLGAIGLLFWLMVLLSRIPFVQMQFRSGI